MITGSFIRRGCACLWLCAASAGCSTVADVARDTAVQDLRCPKEEVRTTRNDASAVASPSHFTATGCGRFVKYVCYPVGKASFKCFADQPAQVHDMPTGGP
jgi:hypothetical protein